MKSETPRTAAAFENELDGVNVTAGWDFARQLERELAASNELCRKILSTLRVNFLRGTIKTDDDKQFEAMLNEWSKPSAAMPNVES